MFDATCCRRVTVSLQALPNQRMYLVLMTKTYSCVEYSLPVRYRGLSSKTCNSRLAIKLLESPRVAAFRPFDQDLSAQARLIGRAVQAGAKAVQYRNALPRQDATGHRHKLPAAFLPHLIVSRRPTAAKSAKTGRLSMRLAIKPFHHSTISQPGRKSLAPCSARRWFGARRVRHEFGLPIPPESGRPFRHPSARIPRGALRRVRRQECSNAKQDAYRCDPSGRDTGRRSPRQPRRRV
jgi:hypothetical protein